MKHLIILSQAPLSKQIRRNSYLDEFVNAGYTDTEFWDISQYMHPGMKYCDEVEYELTRHISNIKELDGAIDTIDVSNSVFVLDFWESWDNKEIFLTLSSRKCVYVRINVYDNLTLRPSTWDQFRKLITPSIVIRVLPDKIRSILYKLYARKNHIRPFERYYSSSSLTCSHNLTKINHPDYEEYEFTVSNRIIERKYILFVDTYWGCHPDFKYYYKLDMFQLNPQKYQESLNCYFSYLEEIYKMPVVIALHPKADYPAGAWGGRMMLKYQTKDLITFADMVILQLCNTMSWVVLADKPVALVTNDEYNKTPRSRLRFNMLNRTFGLHAYNIDHCAWENVKFHKVELRKRMDYIYTYLTDKNIEQKRNVDILVHSFESL